MAGSGERGSVDGSLKGGCFSKPCGICVDTDTMTLLISDTEAHNIRRIDLASRTIATVAGARGGGGYRDGDASKVIIPSHEWVDLHTNRFSRKFWTEF